MMTYSSNSLSTNEIQHREYLNENKGKPCNQSLNS